MVSCLGVVRVNPTPNTWFAMGSHLKGNVGGYYRGNKNTGAHEFWLVNSKYAGNPYPATIPCQEPTASPLPT